MTDTAPRPNITIDIGEVSLTGAVTAASGTAKFVRRFEHALAGEMTWRGLSQKEPMRLDVARIEITLPHDASERDVAQAFAREITRRLLGGR